MWNDGCRDKPFRWFWMKYAATKEKENIWDSWKKIVKTKLNSLQKQRYPVCEKNKTWIVCSQNFNRWLQRLHSIYLVYDYLRGLHTGPWYIITIMVANLLRRHNTLSSCLFNSTFTFVRREMPKCWWY